MELNWAAINWWAVLVAAVASFIVGGIWYGAVFLKAWVKLHGFTEEKQKELGKKQGMNFALFFACDLLMALVVSLLVAALNIHSLMSGAALGLWLWLGLQMTQTLSLNAAAGKPAGIFWIDASKQLAALVAMGMILGAWR